MRLSHPPCVKSSTSKQSSSKPIFWHFWRIKNSLELLTPFPKLTRLSLALLHTRGVSSIAGEDRPVAVGIINLVLCVSSVARQVIKLLSVGDDQPIVRYLAQTDYYRTNNHVNAFRVFLFLQTCYLVILKYLLPVVLYLFLYWDYIL